MKSIFVFTFILWVFPPPHTGLSICDFDGCKPEPGNLRCQSCNPGCYGHDCRQTCRGKCSEDGCDRTTGECFKCKPGFYGQGCDTTCPVDCESRIDGIPYCHRESGSCPEFRHSNCPANCKHSVCSKFGEECLQGCNNGWRGKRCDKTCLNCREGRCAENGYCILGCKPGYYGDTCESDCPNCYNTGCDRKAGICEQCHPGFHGKTCMHECHHNCYQSRDGHRHCDRTDGHCQDGCKSGWYGAQCKTCSKNCKEDKCHSRNGHCLSCKKGRHGSHCNSRCSINCKMGSCHQNNGACNHGCKNGWYGTHCNSQCSINCKMGLCHKHNGVCNHGCKNGWYGTDCNSQCSINCKIGSCHRHNGACIGGCKNGWYGSDCNHNCPDQCNQDRCKRQSNPCKHVCIEHCVKCDKVTGQCLNCQVGFCGANCSYRCNIACEHDICNPDGTCLRGCNVKPHLCNPNCKECSQSSDDCKNCLQNYRLEKGLCISSAFSNVIFNFMLLCTLVLISFLSGTLY